eukprot:804933_1
MRTGRSSDLALLSDLGKERTAIPNCRQVKLKPDAMKQSKIHIYTLEFDPTIPEEVTSHRQQLIYKKFGRKVKKFYGLIFLDNLRMYSLHLVEGMREFQSSEFSLKVHHVKSVDIDASNVHEEVHQIQTVILKRALSEAVYERRGRKYFDKR